MAAATAPSGDSLLTRITTNPLSPCAAHRRPSPADHLVSLLRAATGPRHAAQAHAQAVLLGLASLPLIHSTLVSAYARCGDADDAFLLAASTPSSPATRVVTFTSLVAHFSRACRPSRSLAVFSYVRREGLRPNHYTFSAVLPACAETGVLANGEQVHALATKHGLDADIFVGTAAVDMYAKCGEVGLASKLFDKMPRRNIVTWNAMIVGLVDNRRYDETVSFFREIYGEESVNPDQVSFSSVLCACASNGGLVFGKQVHACAIKLGVDSLAYVNNSLIDMYGKCGSFIESRLLFGCASHKDVVTWNVIAMGWTQNDQFEEACTCFWAMRREGIHPDEASFSTALYASAGLAALDQGASVHSQIVKTGFVKNPCVGSSLITMYAKCGDLEHALRVFQEMEGSRSVVSWTAMIKACQQHGRGNQVIDLFEKMLGEGLEPDYITYVCILSACSHNGLVDRGFQYFNSMSEVHGIDPGYEHYACMVDMLGRAGRLVEARALINKMPIAPDASIWGALLGACRNYGSLDMGKEAAYKLFEMEPHNSGNYVLLCSMYVRHGKFKEAEEVRRLMGLNRVRKETSCSWIDVKNRTHVFTVHDRSHHRSNEIYNMLGLLEDLVKKKGYVAELQYAIDGVEEHKEHDLWYHSERLALAFGLISLPASAPIRIKKNIRTCLDCHMVMKLVSDILKREIILRDTNRFHQFTNGSCSCGDYW